MNSNFDAKERSGAARRSRRQRTMGAVTAIGLALTCLMLPLKADDGGRCSAATLQGNYGLAASGTRGAAAPGGLENFILVGVRTYDGHGGFTTISDDHGTASGPTTGITAVGTYTVHGNCSGTATITIATPFGPLVLVSSFVIVDSGKTVKEASMQPSLGLATAVLTRM